MSKLIRQLCSIFLVLAILIQMIPLSVFAKDSAEDLLTSASTELAAEQADSVEVLGEDLSKRDEFYKEFILDNGLRLATIYPTAVHYEREGQWEEIDNTLTAKIVNAQAVYTNTAGPWEVRFPQQLSGSNAISLTKDGYTVSFTMAGELRSGGNLAVAAADAFATQTITTSSISTAQIQPIDTAALKAAAEFEATIPDKLYARIRYDAVYSGTNVVYDLDGGQLKESIVIRSYDAALRGYRYELDAGGLIPVLNENQSIELRNPVTGDVVMTMPAPFMLDAEDEFCDDVQVSLVSKGGKYLLVYQLPTQWLAEPNRAWPVILDPVVSANNDRTNIQDITVAETGTESNNATTIKCGYHLTKGVLRTYLRFKELPKLTSSDVIVKAEVSLIKPYDSDLAAAIEVHKVTAPWQASETSWSNMPGFDTTVEDITVVQNPATYTWNITDIARSWYADTANTLLNNTGMMFKATNAIETGGTKNWQQFCSSDYGSDRPILTIQYRPAAGLESYWDTSSSAAGRAGTGYIQNYSGNLVWIHSDMGFGGNRMPVSISHVYNAGLAWETDTNTSANPFGLGNGWRTNYHQRILNLADIGYVWEDGDGTWHEFAMTTSGIYEDKDDLGLTLTASDTGYTLTDKYDNTSTFDTSGRLIRQTDNQKIPSSVVITYQDSKISEITDGVGRKYVFSYENGLLEKITYYGTGETALYMVEYDYVGTELTTITYEDDKLVYFDYTDKSLLSSVTDIDGYTLSYTYNTLENGKPSRVASVTEYSGGAAGGMTTLSYAYNCTALTDHDNKTQTHFFNIYGNTISIQNSEGQAVFSAYATDENEYGDPNRLRESSQQQVTVANMLQNTSFESGTAWASASSSVGSSVDDNTHYLGQKSMKSEASAGGVTGPTCTYTAQPNQTYTFSAYVMVGSGAVKLQASVGSATANSRVLMVGSEWARLEVTITNPDAVSQPLTLSVVHEAPGTAYIDCVQLENTHGASHYNLLENADFSYSAQSWTLSTGVFPSVGQQSAPKLDGTVMRINGSTDEVRSISQSVALSGEAGDMYVFGGWGKGDSLALTGNRTFRLVLTFHNADGSTTDVPVSFNENLPDNQWQYAARGAVATQAYSSITVRAEYAYQAGTAYFDGIQLYKEGFGTRYGYDANGNVTQVRDILGQVTEYTYDTNNELTLTELPTGVKIETTYAYHNLTSSKERYTDDEGLVVTMAYHSYTYDDYGNQIMHHSESNGVISESFATYTSDNNHLATTKDEAGYTTTYHYNSDTSVLEWVQYPEDTEDTRTEYTYDEMFRLQITEVTTDQGQTMYAQYSYGLGQLTQIQTATTTYGIAYGDYSLRTNVSVGGNSLATYEYTEDENHHLSVLEYGNGNVVKYTYDDLGRVTQEEYCANKNADSSRTVTYEYNETGNLSKMADSKTGTTTTYSYDHQGRLSYYTETGRDEMHVVRYGYDEHGRLTASSESHGSQRFSTDHVYDSKSRIATTITGQSASTLTYDDFNRITFRQVGYQTNSQAWVVVNESINYRNTMNATTSNQVSQITINSASYNAEYHYGYDANGNIISVSDGVNTTSYVYDSVNQLIRENNQQEGKTWTWTYDTAGNITSKQEYSYTTGKLGPVLDVIDYNYGNESWGDLLTSYDGQAIIYDTIGNPLVHGTRNYTWTEGRRLSKLAEGENTWEFSYDGRGMRTERSNGAIVYSYVYDGGQLKKMTCGDLGMCFFYDASGYPISIMFNGSYYYLVQNLQGDVVAILDNNGVQVVGYSYDAWGVILSTTGSMSSTLGAYNPFRYRSYIYDCETGLYYLQSRYYDPVVGRFISGDNSVSTGQGVLGNNMFAYCNNNPVNAFDPTGEAAIWYYLFEAGRFGFIHECVQNHILFRYCQRSLTKEYSVYTGRADIVDTKTCEVWEIKHGKSAAYFDERMSNATYQATKYLQQKAIGKLGAAHAFQGDFIINCLQESYLVSYWTPQEGAILYSVELLPDYQSIYDYKFEPIVKPNRNESILDKPNFSFRPNYSQDMLNGLVFLAAATVVAYATGLWGLLFL